MELLTLALQTASCVVVSTLFYYLAIQRPYDRAWATLLVLHVVCQTCPIFLVDDKLDHQSHYILVSFFIYSTAHTASILCLKKNVIHKSYKSFTEELRNMYRGWGNIRRLPLAKNQPTTNRIVAGFVFCGRFLVLLSASRLVEVSVVFTVRNLHITIADFAPSKQGLIPSLSGPELTLRAIITAQWIWSSYSALTAGHNILAIFFVSILGWDDAAEWPPLFGSIAEAYSLRRFWGSFWHRLHVAPFAAFTEFRQNTSKHTKSLDRPIEIQNKGSANKVAATKAARALLVFVFSALCHSIVNYLVTGRSNAARELRFWFWNYAGCLAETIVGRARNHQPGSRKSVWSRLVGYVWVACFLFCLTPAWQYPLILAAAGYPA